MKPLKWTVILLAVLFVVFTFIPTSHSSTEVVNGFLNTTSSFSNQPKNASFLTSQYSMPGTLDESTSEAVASISKSVSSVSGTLFTDIVQICDDMTNVWTSPTHAGALQITSGGDLGPRSSGTHGGTDLNCYGGSSWVCTPISGTVIRSQYEKSRGRTVTVQSDVCPALLFRICHLAPGKQNNGGYDPPSWSTTYTNGEPMSQMGQSPTQYEKDNGYNGYGDTSSTWAGGSVLVKEGDHVDAGDKLGISGQTGHSYGRHLHVEFILWCDVTTGEVSPFTETTDFYRPTYRCSVFEVLSQGSFSGVQWKVYNGSDRPLGESITLGSVSDLLTPFLEEDDTP